MEKALEKLSASSLRHLLIKEIIDFTGCLELGSTEELEKKKLQLKEILNVLKQKEQEEMAHLKWGKNSP